MESLAGAGVSGNPGPMLAKAPSSLVSNRGYRSFLTVSKEGVSLDEEKIKADARFDGIGVLTTNTKLPAKEVALKYKELWMVEHTFRDMKSVIDTRPIFHKRERRSGGMSSAASLPWRLKKSWASGWLPTDSSLSGPQSSRT